MKGQLFPFRGNRVHLGVPFLFRGIWKKEGGGGVIITMSTLNKI